MPMKWMWGVGVFWAVTVSATPAGAECLGPATVIKPERGAGMAEFKAWFNKREEAEWGVYDHYAADLDNDGTGDFAVASNQGSGGYLYMKVYSRQPDGSFKEREGAPPTPRGSSDGSWYYFMYYDQDSLTPAPFTRLCGKTYMSFEGRAGGHSRDSYFWDASGNQPACGPAWTALIRADFKKRYEGKEYEWANDVLAGFLIQCSQALDDTTRAWIANDIAITQYHLGNSQNCLKYAAQAKKEPRVQRAAQYNESLCAKAAENISLDFSWLLEPSLTNTNQIVMAKPFDMLLRAVVPDLKTDNAVSSMRGAALEGLHGPPSDKEVRENRYVTASACAPHACDFKAMMWVDIQEHIGLIAFNSADFTPQVKTRCELTLVSRLVGPKAIPATFWRAFKEWRSRNDLKLTGDCVSFIAEDGTARDLSPPH